MIYEVERFVEVYVGCVDVLVCVFFIFESYYHYLYLSSNVSLWVKAFLIVVEDFVLFTIVSEHRCSCACVEFVYCCLLELWAYSFFMSRVFFLLFCIVGLICYVSKLMGSI